MVSGMEKKALIFIEDGSFSFDNRVIREANALVENGWEVTVISPKYANDPFCKVLSPRLRALYYPKINAQSAAGHVLEHAMSLVFGSLLTLWAFVRYGFSVFHACNPMDILWIVFLPYRLLGKKFIFDQHDLCPELYRSRDEKEGEDAFYKTLIFLEGMSYRHADAVIATNESYREIAMTRGGKRAGDVFVVRNGPDLSKFRKLTPNRSYKEPGETLVGYLGNMNVQDGVDYLVKAASEIVLARGRKDIKFILVGGGSYQPTLVEMARKMGLEANVHFTGRVPDDEMLSALNACDMCVQPDPYNPLNNMSTMNKVMEYMALEKPVIAFDLKETRVSGGEAVLYVPPNDIGKLADQIMHLADQAELRVKMGAIGRARIETKLSWNYSVPHLLQAYEQVAK